MAPRTARSSKPIRKACMFGLIVAFLALTTGSVSSGGSQQGAVKTQTFGEERLISWEPLPEWSGETYLFPAEEPMSLAALRPSPGPGGTVALRQGEPARGQQIDRDPLRVIRDPYPSFSSVAVDMERGEVVVGDENLFQILVYDRLADTPPTATLTEPKRIIAGDQTAIEFVCGLYVDPETGDIYAIDADTAATLQVFTRGQEGNVPPARQLHTGSEVRGRGLAVDSVNNEIVVTSQHNHAVVVFRKQAEGEEPPLRLLQGDRTGLGNPHGIAIDTQNDLLFVTNHGQASSRPTEGNDPATRPRPNMPLGRRDAVRGSGRFEPPSITVYDRTASGDTPPLRVIAGPRTRLNWPAGIVVDERRGELFVANDTGDSVLVFPSDASGDVAPIRVIEGADTFLESPGGIYLDTTNDELWVSNYGNHSLTVYPPTADGNVAPLRTIRSGPLGSTGLMIGNPGFVAYDTMREEVLVPN